MSDDEKVNILLVDDEPSSLVALEAVLSPLGQNIVNAHSGIEALRYVLAMDLAVIILDVQMPVIDGFETAALIRERERSKATPIIFLTAALRSEAMVFKGYSIGAVDYLIKPVIPEVLRSKVEVFVDLARKTTQLRQMNEHLHDQAAQLASTNRELETFSHSVSHDLRAPLRHIEGFSDALLQECANALSPVGREYLVRIGAATKRMSELIEDLLALARVARAEIHRGPMDIAAMAESIADEMRRTAPTREVEFVIDKPLVAHCDPRLIRIALENLIGNAWKYTGKHPRALIEVGSVTGENGEQVFFVRDDGAGFDVLYADKLFAPFQRLHSPSEFEGTGVGLATVQRIIHRHGGRIWAEAAPEKGATFYFTLM